MAHSRKHSRAITAGGRQFRWHVDINDDYPWEKVVSVFPAEDPNGARLAMSVVAKTIFPRDVSRLIGVGMRLGYEPDDRAKSLVVPAEHVSEILHGHSRLILQNGVEYIWTPESHGGLHVKVRRADAPDGQLLATFDTLVPEDLCESFVSRVIDAALAEGWLPCAVGLDCHWLGAATCGRIIADVRALPA